MLPWRFIKICTPFGKSSIVNPRTQANGIPFFDPTAQEVYQGLSRLKGKVISGL